MPVYIFGIGHVDPANGSGSNTGFDWSSPLKTIESAISEGFEHIRTLSGTHTLSSITSPLALEFFPGWHRFSGGPVACTVPVNLLAAGLIAPDGTNPEGAAYITATSPITDYFQFDDGANLLYGGMFQGLYFDESQITRSAIYATNLSGAVAEYNYLRGSSWSNIPLFYLAPTASGEASYWCLEANRPYYRPLLIVDNDNDAPMDGWSVRDNICDGVAAADPLIHFGGSSGQSLGLAVVNNALRGTTGSCPAAVYIETPTNQLFYGRNSGRNLAGTDNLALRVNDAASSVIEHSLGDVAADGNIRLNGQLYSATTPDTGSDGRGGRDLYDGTNKVRIVIEGRY